MGLSRKEKENYTLYKNPKSDITIKENDYLIILVDGNSKKDLEKDFSQKEGRA
ncbi:MAG: hypothetical protein PHW82_08370 [Bacteroidales bacterium]|nr:hypothetical protein [Bacteroidales bacterium]